MPLRAVIKTARLNLRPLAASDEAALVAAIDDFEIARWLYFVPHPYRTADFAEFLPSAVPGETWAIDDANGFCGLVGYDGELGYWLARSAWGRGYATEAARAVIAEHFSDPAAGDVASGHFEGNDRSRKVLLTLGFERCGHRIVRAISRPGDEILFYDMRLRRSVWVEANPPFVR